MREDESICTICGRSKKPIGKDSKDNGRCDWDCEGYLQEPKPPPCPNDIETEETK